MLISLSRRMGFARALRSHAFALLWSGQTISSLGDNAYFTALAWQVLLLTGSGTAMGLIGVAGGLPRILFLLVGGAVADRVPRRLVLLWSDAGRAVVVFVIAALGLLHLMQFWHLLGLSLLFGIADGFFMPAYQAIPPQLVEAELLSSANALTGISEQIGVLAGPAIGAALVAAASPSSAFAFDGATFLISALCLIAMRSRKPTASALAVAVVAGTSAEVAQPAPAEAGAEPARGLRGMVEDIRLGFRYVAATPWLWVTILVASLANLAFVGAYFTAMPRLVRDHFGAGVWLLGVFATMTAIGLLLGTLLIGQFQRVRHRGWVLYAGWITSGVAMVMMALPLPHAAAPVIASAASMSSGVGLGIAGVVWNTLLQQRVPADLLGRVISIDWLGSLALTPIGFVVAGILTDARGAAWVFGAAGITSVMLLALGLCSRGVRTLD